MFLTVRYNYGGQWTALYWIGPTTPQSPPIAAEHPYLWYGTHGYDGQAFHIMAHDPWMRYGPPENFGMMPMRWVRILVPMLAWTIALGQDRWIDPAYYFVILAFTFLGGYWTARWAERVKASPWVGVLFAATPAAITAADRMLCDVALVALCAGFVVYAEVGPRWKLFLVLVAAGLTRETGMVLVGAYGAYALGRRRWADAALACVAAVPFVGWELFVRAHSIGSTKLTPIIGWIPFEGFLRRVGYVFDYPLPKFWAAIAAASDYVALACVAIVFAMAVRLAVRREWKPASVAIYAYTVAAMLLKGEGEWFDAYSFGRLQSPLMFLAALAYLPRAGWIAFAPVVIVGLRVTVWLGKQLTGIIHALLS
jgi:hypothetical protein